MISLSSDALEFIRAKAELRNGVWVAPFFACREAARESGISVRAAEIAALRGGVCPSRYERSAGTFGLDGQAAILESRVAVAGCGGLGGWIIEMLARGGVGELVLIDGDVFSDNNLNRQLLSVEGNIGVLKAAAAAERVKLINGALSARARNVFIDESNAEELFAGCSAVMDALDSNRSRSCVFAACRKLGIPFIHGAIGGLYGQSAVFYPDDMPVWEVCEAPDKGEEQNAGNPPFTPAFIASVQAAEVLMMLSGAKKTRPDFLFWFDIEKCSVQKIKIGRQPG